MKGMPLPALAAAALLLTGVGATRSAPARHTGWTAWRGPNQNGTSPEKGLPSKLALAAPSLVWRMDLPSGCSPVIADGHVYVFGYQGTGPDLQEVLVCADAETGKKLWERRFNDFISDIAYDRYTIGAPAVDPETGNVFVLSSAGELAAFTPQGQPVWRHSLMDEFGRLTFTNGRTGAPLVLDDLVLFRSITSNWGADGPASDRIYALDKKSGNLVWSSTPGAAPKDYSFATPYVAWRKGKQVLYTGLGDGSIACVNARTGQPIWRYPVSAGGMNASVVMYKDMAIAIHNDENLDTSTIGRMVAVRVSAEPQPAKPGDVGAPVLDRSAEVWRNDLGTVSASPVIVGNRIYQCIHTGHLCCVDADTGKVLWEHKLAPDQLHASVLYADGKLYVPMQNGTVHVIKPTDAGAQELSVVQLPGRCLGQPVAWNGKIYVTSTKGVFCFGKRGPNPGMTAPALEALRPKPGPTAALQIIPAETLLRPGEKVKLTVRGIDANGFPTETFAPSQVKWERYIPPTARVRSEMSASVDGQGVMTADSAPKPSAGAFKATAGSFEGIMRGRVIPGLPFKEDFNGYDLSVAHETETGVKFAYPPLTWIGARFKWEVRDLDGEKVLAKTLDNIFFQRATVFFGHPAEKNYTVEADVRSDGNRRTMSSVGLVNQRYLVTLLGNAQQLEVSSNQERVRASVPFAWERNQWYHLKTRVDVAPDGSGVVRARAWKKGDAEPSAWTIEVPHKHAHTQGAPGFFGFAPQSLYRVYVDNITVTPN